MMRRPIVWVMVLVLLLVGCSQAPAVEYGPDVENPYPEVQAPLMGSIIDMSPEEILAGGSSYIKGVVKKVNPPVTEKAVAEWFDVLLEKDPDTAIPNITYYSFTFTVDSVLAGAEVPDEITVFTIFQTSLPEDLSVGDSFILAVNPTDAEGAYGLGHVTLSFYYISEEDRVYPAGRAESSLQYTGMTVDMFKDALNK